MYPCIAVEHSYNCMVLLCRLFLGPSRHYTNFMQNVELYNARPYGDIYMRVNCVGNSVQVSCVCGSLTTAVGKDYEVYTTQLPEKYRPKAPLQTIGSCITGERYMLQIGTDGKIIIHAYDALNIGVSFTDNVCWTFIP